MTTMMVQVVPTKAFISSYLITFSLISISGLTQKLDYIQKLGVESIWLSPIYESEGEGGNVDFIIDHGKIDSRFGTEDDFKTLLSEVQQRGVHLNIKLETPKIAEHLFYEVTLMDSCSSFSLRIATK